MKQVNVSEAKGQLSRLIADALCGDEIVLARNGKPLVRLVPVRQRKPSDAFALDRGKVWIAPDFDAMPPEFNDYM